MISLRLTSAGLAQMRFAYSPLAEAAKSLYVVHSGAIHPLHRGWYERVRADLRKVDGDLLRAVVPPGGHVAEFLFVGATGTHTTIEDQLELVANWPHDHFLSELEVAWRGVGVTPASRRLLEEPNAPQKVAVALEHYWQVAVAPYWSRLRGVLDADVAYRLGKLAHGGIAELMVDLHPSVQMTDREIRIRSLTEWDVDGTGLTLVPCVFVWPHLWVEPGLLGPPSLTYGARGIGALWDDHPSEAEDEDALAALLGRSRAEILVSLRLPRSNRPRPRARADPRDGQLPPVDPAPEPAGDLMEERETGALPAHPGGRDDRGRVRVRRRRGGLWLSRTSAVGLLGDQFRDLVGGPP